MARPFLVVHDCVLDIKLLVLCLSVLSDRPLRVASRVRRTGRNTQQRTEGGPRRAAQVCAAPGALLMQQAGHVPVQLARRDCPPTTSPRAAEVQAEQNKNVQQPARCTGSKSRTSPGRSRYATAPLPTAGGGVLHRAAPVCAAPGASLSQRAGHVPVTLPPLPPTPTQPQASGPCQHKCVQKPAQSPFPTG
jgi:hypothetical protein